MSKLGDRVNYLLVIGIDRYQDDRYNNLNNSVLGCGDIIKELTGKYNFQTIVDPIYNELATRRNILEKLTSLQYLTTDEDNLIIYYAGHGQINHTTGKGSWIPFDASDSAIDYIPNVILKDIVEDIKAKHIFLISDSCFSGTFLTKGDNINEKNYSKLDSRKSRWYLASGGIETVSDGKPGQGSPFTNSLINYLKENENTYISILEIITEVVRRTGNISNQQPIGGEIKNPDHELGQMVLVKSHTVDNDFSKNDEVITREMFGSLMRTYGFYFGQERSLDIIEKRYKELKKDVLLARLEWKLSFNSSVENIINTLQKTLADGWDNYNKILIEHLDTFINEDDFTLETSKEFIVEVGLRAKGFIPSPMLEILLAYKPEFDTNPLEEYRRGFKRTLYSLESTKSQGFEFEIEIPLSWSIREGKRPHVLWFIQNFHQSVMAAFTVVLNTVVLDLNISDDEWTKDTTKEIADLQLQPDFLLGEIATEKVKKISDKRVIIDRCHGLERVGDYVLV